MAGLRDYSLGCNGKAALVQKQAAVKSFTFDQFMWVSLRNAFMCSADLIDQLVLRLAEHAGLVQLVVDHGLIQVVSLETEPFDLLGWSPFIHSLLMGSDSLESLLQERLAGLRHA